MTEHQKLTEQAYALRKQLADVEHKLWRIEHEWSQQMQRDRQAYLDSLSKNSTQLGTLA